jgi:aspartyl-tRNA(Asn)/glutamyl-tRNA(Gln) amidotransferase subunit C
MAVSREEIEHLAQLTRLAMPPEEIDRMVGEISGILTHINRLQELDTEHISPTAQAIILHDVVRSDETAPSLPTESVLANAPERYENYFVVPAVFGE